MAELLLGDNGDSVADQLEVLKLIAARLDALGVHYMLTGSVAAGWYGQPRMTRDIDLVAVERRRKVDVEGRACG
jgi:hypothetical protein